MNFAYLASFGSFPSANCLLNELLYHLALFFVIAVLLCFVVEKQMIGPNFWDGTTLLFCFQKLSLIQVVMGVPKKWSSYCFFFFVFNTLHRLMGTISEKFHQHQLIFVFRCFCTKFLKTPALQNHCRTTRAMKVGSSNANANTSEMSLKVRGVKRVKLHL